MKRGLLVLALTSAGLLVACGGGGGSSTTTTTTSTTPTSLTVNVQASCTVNQDTSSSPATYEVYAAPSSSPASYCAQGVTSDTHQFFITLAGSTCPSGQTLAVSAKTTNCGGTLSNSYIPGGSTTINLSPSSTTSVGSYAGTWSATYYTNPDTTTATGTCTVQLNSDGTVDLASSICTPTATPSATYGFVSGALNDAGQFSGVTATGSTYVAQFNATDITGGTWTNPNGASGTWTAKKN